MKITSQSHKSYSTNCNRQKENFNQLLSKVVYVRTGETTEKRQVKIGITNTDFAQVISGVNEGEEILLVEPGRTVQKKS